MEPGKGPDGDEPLPFLIPLGPEGEESPSSGGYTPVPVRPAQGNPPPPGQAAGPPPPAAKPAGLAPGGPLVFVDSLGHTQHPLLKKAPPGPLPDPAGLVSPFSITPAAPPPLVPPPVPGVPGSGAPAPFADFFLGKPQEGGDKPFKPPPVGPEVERPPAPFAMPKMDGPVASAPKSASPEPLPSSEQGAFRLPSMGPATGSFRAPGADAAPAPFAPASTPAPRPIDLPLTAPPPGAAAAPPGAPALKQPNPTARAGAPRDSSAIPRQPLTAPPIRLPGSQPAAPKPLTGVLFDAGAAKPAPARPPSGAPLSLVEYFESSARLAFAPARVLERCRAAPEPAVGLSLAHALAWVLASFVIRTGLAIGQPSSLGGAITPGRLGVAVVLGLIGSTVAIFVGGALAHGLGRLSGGSGSYPRGLQVASLLAPVSALAAALSPVGSLWWAPGLVAAYLLARALAGLYAAPIVQVGVIVGTLAVGGVAAQYRARVFLERMREAAAPAEAAMQAVQAAGQLTSQQAAVLEQLQSQGQLSPGEAAEAGQAVGNAMTTSLQLLQQAGQADPAEGQAPVQSGPQAGHANSAAGAPLGQNAAAAADVAKSLMPLLGAAAQGRNMTPAQKAELDRQSNAVLKQAEAALNAPGMTEGMSPAERQQFLQLQQATQAIFRAGKGGPPPTKAEADQLMRNMQGMMKAYQENNPPAQPELRQARKKRRRAPRPVEE